MDLKIIFFCFSFYRKLGNSTLFFFRQARTGHLAKEGLRVLNNLMACNYTRLESYLEFGKSHNWLFSHNNRNYIILFIEKKSIVKII